jgi:hypothetical protein
MTKHRRGADFLYDMGLELFSQHPRAGMLVTKKLFEKLLITTWYWSEILESQTL